MLEQALVALAAAGGTAVVQAAGTDVWIGLRGAVARWFGRGDERRERAELERLDQTAAELEAGDEAAVERSRIRQETVWQTRIEALLETLDDAERARAVDELRALLEEHAPAGGVSVRRDGIAAGRDVTIRADGGIAGGVIHGGAHLGTPPPPGPVEG